MGVPLPRPAALAARLETPIEDWPYLDEGTLVKTRSRELHPGAHLPAAPGADRPRRASGVPLPGLD